MTLGAVLAYGLILVMAPALPGVATRTRSSLTGRRGPPVLQLYYELGKLLRKRALFSVTTTDVFRAAPVLEVAALLVATALLPLDGYASLAGFSGDLVLFAGLLALGRFLTLLAALDTGSSFEGMGASRDAMIGAFAETALWLALGALALVTGRTRLADMLGPPLAAAWESSLPSLVMIGVGLFVLLLAEAGRVPVDDPATHLELTMIHEVAILDHSGPDLALLLYARSLKFALLATLVASALVPRGALGAVPALALLPLLLALTATAAGVVEAVMARLRLDRVPQLLVATSTLTVFATILLLMRQ